MVCFAVFAYEYYEKSVKPLAITFAALALLFQPFAKIALGRTMWNVVDVVAALGLILLVYKPKSVIRISLCRTAKRNPLIFPI